MIGRIPAGIGAAAAARRRVEAGPDRSGQDHQTGHVPGQTGSLSAQTYDAVANLAAAQKQGFQRSMLNSDGRLVQAGGLKGLLVSLVADRKEGSFARTVVKALVGKDFADIAAALKESSGAKLERSRNTVVDLFLKNDMPGPWSQDHLNSVTHDMKQRLFAENKPVSVVGFSNFKTEILNQVQNRNP